MKKIILLLAFIVPVMASGQEANIKKARKLAKKMTPDFVTAKSLIDAALKDETTKNLSETWYTKGFIEFRKYESEDDKRFEVPPRKPNLNFQSEGAYNAFTSWIVADSLDKIESLSNPKRKGKLEYRKDIVDDLTTIKLYIFQHGYNLYEKKDYIEAKQVFDDFLKLPELEMIKGSGEDIKATDTVFLDTKEYLQATLRQIYLKQVSDKDTVGFVKTMNEGAERFPQNIHFLSYKIDYYKNTNRIDDALENINKAILLDDKNAVLYYMRGVIGSIKKSDKAKIKADYKKAMELNPEWADVVFEYALLILEDADKVYQHAQIQQIDSEKEKANEIYRTAIPYLLKAKELGLESNKDDLLRKLMAVYYKLGMTEKYNEIRAERGQ